jgi:di/tricarboxylate transporter
MTVAAIITLIIIVLAIILFATEWISIDLVSIIVMLLLILSGVISPEQGVSGFSNKATITVAFMFIISAAILKTGALQVFTHKISSLFKKNYKVGLFVFLLFIAFISAFINNTPVVAVFIPVVIQIARKIGKSPSQLLIPLSYAAIWGGVCTLIGTSTNIVVSGVAEKAGIEPISLFQMTPVGIILTITGILFLVFGGTRLLPNRENDQDLEKKFGFKNYITEIVLLPNSDSIGKKLMDSKIIKDFDLDVLQIKRGNSEIIMPSGDFTLESNDILKVRCDIDKIKGLKDRAKIEDDGITMLLGDSKLTSRNVALVELVVASNSDFQGRTLKELDFRRRFRAIPLAIRHRKEVLHSDLYDTKLKSGDIILAEVKTHYLKELKKMENENDSPFILLSEDTMLDFNLKNFTIVLTVIFAVILTAAFGWIDIMVGSIAAVSILVLSQCLTMKDAYESINWQVIFLLAGSLSMGVAMNNTGLDLLLAKNLVHHLEDWGPIAVMSGLYILTALLGELMSNNATAALITPIAIATAHQLNVDHLPFLMAVTFASSASFMTPVGYQTNAMVYGAGQYKFMDFFKVGLGISIIFWIIISILIPIFYPF